MIATVMWDDAIELFKAPLPFCGVAAVFMVIGHSCPNIGVDAPNADILQLALPTKGLVELSHIVERVTQVLDRVVGIRKMLGLVVCGRSDDIILLLDEVIWGTGIIVGMDLVQEDGCVVSPVVAVLVQEEISSSILCHVLL